MTKQLRYDEIQVGQEIPAVTKNPTKKQLVQWAGATGDFAEIHYDKDAALNAKLPGVIIHGRLKAAFLGELMTRWVGADGRVAELKVSYRGIDVPGLPLQCKGKVTNKYVKGKEHCVECEVWTENSKGEKTTVGTAVAVLK